MCVCSAQYRYIPASSRILSEIAQGVAGDFIGYHSRPLVPICDGRFFPDSKVVVV